jgi:hypothetical protein
MAVISVTRLRLRSVRFLPQFLWANFVVTRQIAKTSGFLRGRLFVDAELTFWTTTAWNDAGSLRSFRDSGAHKRAMPRLAKWCSEATTVHWDQLDDHLPDWKQAYDRLVREGRVIYVNNPSEFQKERKFPEPRLSGRLQRALTPRSR